MMRVYVIGVVLLAASPAAAANVCQAGPLLCATTMPVGGFCECTGKGQSHEGTVVAKAPKGQKINSSAGGCGAHPGAPGCK